MTPPPSSPRGGKNIEHGMWDPTKTKPLAKFGDLGVTPQPQDGCVPAETPCGCCASCRRRAAVRVLGEALEDEAHAPWTLEETGRVLGALGLELSPRTGVQSEVA